MSGEYPQNPEYDEADEELHERIAAEISAIKTEISQKQTEEFFQDAWRELSSSASFIKLRERLGELSDDQERHRLRGVLIGLRVARQIFGEEWDEILLPHLDDIIDRSITGSNMLFDDDSIDFLRLGQASLAGWQYREPFAPLSASEFDEFAECFDTDDTYAKGPHTLMARTALLEGSGFVLFSVRIIYGIRVNAIKATSKERLEELDWNEWLRRLTNQSDDE